MNYEEILEYNKRCATFLGAVFYDDDKIAFPEGYYMLDSHEFDLPCQLTDMSFHSDWNWIMYVIDKIESTNIKKGFGYYYCFKIGYDWCTIEGSDGKIIPTICYRNKIESTIQAIDKFLIWYNLQN